MKTQSNLVDATLAILAASLNCRVELPLDDARRVLGKFPVYDDIPSRIYLIVDEIKRAIGPVDFGGNNPNNGSYSNISFSIGNEYSLVIYVKSRLFYRKNDKPAAQVAALKAIGNKFKADEVTVEVESNPIVAGHDVVIARFWWD